MAEFTGAENLDRLKQAIEKRVLESIDAKTGMVKVDRLVHYISTIAVLCTTAGVESRADIDNTISHVCKLKI